MFTRSITPAYSGAALDLRSSQRVDRFRRIFSGGPLFLLFQIQYLQPQGVVIASRLMREVDARH